MYKNKKILAVVMARGGSKGIINKNLRKIGKSSLVYLAGKICTSIKYIDKSMVSTDSIKIGREAKRSGLNFFFLRPKKLSGGKIPDQDVLKHALIKAEIKYKTKFDFILSIPPTTPTRTNVEVISALKKTIDKKFDSLWTISLTDNKYHPDKSLKIEKNKLKFYNKAGNKIIYRQQLSDIYHRNGVAYIIRRNLIKNKIIINKNTGFLISKSKHVSIDSLEDLKLAKKILLS